jgi:HrpA-like RNA helicase
VELLPKVPLPDLGTKPAAMPGGPRDPLPIDAYREEIVRAIMGQPVVLIQGETGCGKSSRVPQFIYHYCRGAAKYLRGGEGERSIVCVQPHTIGAINLAKRVSAEMGDKELGGIVGYKACGTEVADPKKTKIVFMTVEYLLQTLIESPG